MKRYKLIWMFFALILTVNLYAQTNSTSTVVAKNRDISDNLDLQAVASIFGDAKDLEDFEKKLNDPNLQISNLDLNQDGYVDYLRVLEVAEGDVRVIVIQAVLGQDQFQDVATIELEKQRATASNSNTNVTIQIVGNPYIYGPNYIYEPYYYRPPVFFDFFWMASYRPYYSPWYWGYYPTYYSYWAPVPYFRYNRNVYQHINRDNRYIYTDTRRVSRADRLYSNVRGNTLERQNPNRSFESRNRNANVTNRYAFDKERTQVRTANFSNDRVQSSTNRTTSSNVRNESVNTRTNVGNGNLNTATLDRTSNGNDIKSTSTRVRSDFNANRTNVSSTRVTVPSSNNSTVRSTNLNTNSTTNSNSNRIERTNRSYNSNSSNSGNINRSYNSGSINRSSSPAPSRSMNSSSVRSSGSSSSGRTIGR